MDRYDDNKDRLHIIIENCKKLDPIELNSYLRLLADKGDLEALSAVYKADFPFSSWAAGEVARITDSESVVDFCRSFETGSPNWRAVFHALDSHPKENVIDYIRETANCNSPIVRSFCYVICMRSGWDDLLEYAMNDRHNATLLVLPNQVNDELTIGLVAEKYIEAVRRNHQDK
jgi:hypothetical protein